MRSPLHNVMFVIPLGHHVWLRWAGYVPGVNLEVWLRGGGREAGSKS